MVPMLGISGPIWVAASGLSDVDIPKNNGLKGRIGEEFRYRNDLSTAVSLSIPSACQIAIAI